MCNLPLYYIIITSFCLTNIYIDIVHPESLRTQRAHTFETLLRQNALLRKGVARTSQTCRDVSRVCRKGIARHTGNALLGHHTYVYVRKMRARTYALTHAGKRVNVWWAIRLLLDQSKKKSIDRYKITMDRSLKSIDRYKISMDRFLKSIDRYKTLMHRSLKSIDQSTVDRYTCIYVRIPADTNMRMCMRQLKVKGCKTAGGGLSKPWKRYIWTKRVYVRHELDPSSPRLPVYCP